LGVSLSLRPFNPPRAIARTPMPFVAATSCASDFSIAFSDFRMTRTCFLTGLTGRLGMTVPPDGP
jgi:hypothetical protein